MKTTITTIALMFGTATSAMANDFDNATFGLTVNSGMMDFTVDANQNALTDFEVGVTGLAHSLGSADAEVRAALNYNLDADTIGLRGEYNLAMAVADQTVAYGTVGLEYTTTNNNLSNGDFSFDPSVGVTYTLNDQISVFGEVGYTWNISNDWSRTGGYLEVGVPVTVASKVTLTPSLVRTFDDGLESTNAKLSLNLTF
jgi:hypothetical protein